MVGDKEIAIPPTALTLDGFRRWARLVELPNRPRFTFVDNTLMIDCTMEELETHNSVKTAVYSCVLPLNAKDDFGKIFVDGARISNDEGDVSNEPDAALVTWEALETGRARLIPREGVEGQFIEIEGTPDWLMEVISKSSIRKDTVQLRAAYHKAGVGEYWLIDARGDEIDFQILLHGRAGYVAAPRHRGGWQESRNFKRLFRLKREKGRMGLWKYTLEMKSMR